MTPEPEPAELLRGTWSYTAPRLDGGGTFTEFLTFTASRAVSHTVFRDVGGVIVGHSSQSGGYRVEGDVLVRIDDSLQERRLPFEIDGDRLAFEAGPVTTSHERVDMPVGDLVGTWQERLLIEVDGVLRRDDVDVELGADGTIEFRRRAYENGELAYTEDVTGTGWVIDPDELFLRFTATDFHREFVGFNDDDGFEMRLREAVIGAAVHFAFVPAGAGAIALSPLLNEYVYSETGDGTGTFDIEDPPFGGYWHRLELLR